MATAPSLNTWYVSICAWAALDTQTADPSTTPPTMPLTFMCLPPWRDPLPPLVLVWRHATTDCESNRRAISVDVKTSGAREARGSEVLRILGKKGRSRSRSRQSELSAVGVRDDGRARTGPTVRARGPLADRERATGHGADVRRVVMGLRPTRETMKMGYAGAAAFRSTSGI